MLCRRFGSSESHGRRHAPAARILPPDRTQHGIGPKVRPRPLPRHTRRSEAAAQKRHRSGCCGGLCPRFGMPDDPAQDCRIRRRVGLRKRRTYASSSASFAPCRRFSHSSSAAMPIRCIEVVSGKRSGAVSFSANLPPVTFSTRLRGEEFTQLGITFWRRCGRRHDASKLFDRLNTRGPQARRQPRWAVSIRPVNVLLYSSGLGASLGCRRQTQITRSAGPPLSQSWALLSRVLPALLVRTRKTK